MKALLAASAIILGVAGSAMAQTTNDMPNNPAASDQPAARGLGSDDVQQNNAPANNGSIDYGNTNTILPDGAVGGTPAPQVNNNVGGDNQGTPTDTLPGNGAGGSSGSSIGSGTIGSGGASGTGGGSSAY